MLLVLVLGFLIVVVLECKRLESRRIGGRFFGCAGLRQKKGPPIGWSSVLVLDVLDEH